MDQDQIDDAIQAFYGDAFDEHSRLTTRSAQGRLEFERTQELVRATTPAPARVLDLGGGTGVHATALARDGYDVVLIDPVQSHVATARLGGMFSAFVGDARQLELPDDSFDAVLMAGPLYHLASRGDRLQALREARRVCRAGGYVHAAAIPRLTAFAAAALDAELLQASPNAWLDLLRNGTPVPFLRFPAGHYHTPQELHDEMEAAGFTMVEVIGVEGPAGLALETTSNVSEADFAAAKRLAGTFEKIPDVRDFSNHLLATGRA